MKRAEVWRMWPGSWGLQVFVPGMAAGRGGPIRFRPPGITIYPADGITFPSQEAALKRALIEVGLDAPAEVATTPPEHREAP